MRVCSLDGRQQLVPVRLVTESVDEVPGLGRQHHVSGISRNRQRRANTEKIADIKAGRDRLPGLGCKVCRDVVETAVLPGIHEPVERVMGSRSIRVT